MTNNSYRGSRRRRRRRRRRSSPLLPLLCLIVVLGVGAGLYFGGVFGKHGSRNQPTDNTENTQNAENTENAENAENTEKTDNTENTDNVGNTENTEPVDVTPSGPDAYPPITVEGEEQQYDAVYRIGDTGFEMYTYVSSAAEKYAAAVNATADALQGEADVYAITVPLSSGITLPDEKKGGVFGNQQAAEESVASMLQGNVKVISLYDTLMRHRNEYIYYRTDHHWTALGAYYGYLDFCKAKGITPHELSDYWMEEYTGFLGSFYRDSNQNEQIGENPDTVVVYHPVSKNASLDFTGSDGQTIHWQVIYNVSDWRSDMKYNAFIGGDNPYTIITNPDVTDGSSCVVVKESFGNAFVPYLVDHYSTVYVLDYRYWGGNLMSFVRENGVQDVIFINNLSALRSSYLVGKLQGIIE